MKKSISMTLVILVLLLALSPFAVFANTQSIELQGKISALEDGGTLYLDADATIDTTLNVNCTNVTVDGQGHTLTVSGTSADTRAFNISESKSVTLKNLNIDFENIGSGSFAIIVRAGATLTLDNVNIDYKGQTYAIHMGADNSTLNLTNSSIYSCADMECVNIGAVGCSLNVNNSKVVSRIHNAIAIKANAAANIYSGYISSTDGNNPTVLLSDTATLNVYDGYITNTGTHRAISSPDTNTGKVSCNIYGGTFVVNDTGACVNLGASSYTVYGGTFINRRASSASYTMTAGSGAEVVFPNIQNGMVLAVKNAPASGLVTSEHTRTEGGYYHRQDYTPTTGYGASIRLVGANATSGGFGNGIRFENKISAETLEYVKGLADDGKVEYGTVIVPTDYLTDNGLAQPSAAALDALGLPYVKLPAATGIEQQGNDYVFRAALTDIKEQNINRAFSSIAYASFERDGNTVYVYGYYDPVENSRSMVQVANSALADVNATQTDKYKYPTDGVYSPYTQAQRTAIKEYIDIGASVLGVSLAEYKIVLSENASFEEQRFATYFNEHIRTVIGKRLDITTAKGQYNILIGGTSSLNVGENEYAVAINGSDVEIAADAHYSYTAALTYLINRGVGDISLKDNTGEVWRHTLTAADLSGGTELVLGRTKNSDFRIMYHNIYGWNESESNPTEIRNQMLAGMYLAYSPDVLCLQECTAQMRNSSKKSVINAMTAAGYSEIKNNKTGSNAYTETPIMYKTDMFSELASGTVEFGHDDKMYTWAVLREKGTGKTLSVISMHFSYEQTAAGDAMRAEQAEIVAAKAAQLKASYDCAVIVGGDINAKVSEKAYSTITSKGFADIQGTAQISENVGTVYLGYPDYNTELGQFERDNIPLPAYAENAIDHVFGAGANFMPQRFDVVTDTYARCASDHHAILVDFSVKTDYTMNY